MFLLKFCLQPFICPDSYLKPSFPGSISKTNSFSGCLCRSNEFSGFLQLLNFFFCACCNSKIQTSVNCFHVPANSLQLLIFVSHKQMFSHRTQPVMCEINFLCCYDCLITCHNLKLKFSFNHIHISAKSLQPLIFMLHKQLFSCRTKSVMCKINFLCCCNCANVFFLCSLKFKAVDFSQLY